MQVITQCTFAKVQLNFPDASKSTFEGSINMVTKRCP